MNEYKSQEKDKVSNLYENDVNTDYQILDFRKSQNKKRKKKKDRE